MFFPSSCCSAFPFVLPQWKEEKKAIFFYFHKAFRNYFLFEFLCLREKDTENFSSHKDFSAAELGLWDLHKNRSVDGFALAVIPLLKNGIFVFFFVSCVSVISFRVCGVLRQGNVL